MRSSALTTGKAGRLGTVFKRAGRPYWKRAHRDWRVWVGLFSCLAAIIIYVLSEDLSVMPNGRQRTSASTAVGK